MFSPERGKSQSRGSQNHSHRTDIYCKMTQGKAVEDEKPQLFSQLTAETKAAETQGP